MVYVYSAKPLRQIDTQCIILYIMWLLSIYNHLYIGNIVEVILLLLIKSCILELLKIESDNKKLYSRITKNRK